MYRYDGDTLGTLIAEIKTQVGGNLSRIVVAHGCRGHNAPPDHQIIAPFMPTPARHPRERSMREIMSAIFNAL